MKPHCTSPVTRRLCAGTIVGLAAAATLADSIAFAQIKPKPAQTKSGPAVSVQEKGTAAPEAAAPVVIEREALRLTDPKAYQVPLELEPVKWLELPAPSDGTVRTISAKIGDKVDGQTELLRMDNTEEQLALGRAKAEYRVAQIELRTAKAKGGQADAVELAEAKLEAAKATVDLATYRSEKSSIRAPFECEVLRLHVVPEQLVQIGDPLAYVGDTSKLKVEIPVDRKDPEIAPGKTVEIRIEDQPVQATIENVLPLHDRFEPLRELVNSIGSAVVVVDNPSGQYRVGQTVYVPVIPRQSITEIPNAALANVTDGTRKVQVVRDSVVRDIGVQLLGQVGADRIYVSGPFAENDELIVSTSQELPDGTRVRAVSSPAAVESTAQPGTPRQPRRSADF